MNCHINDDKVCIMIILVLFLPITCCLVACGKQLTVESIITNVVTNNSYYLVFTDLYNMIHSIILTL